MPPRPFLFETRESQPIEWNGRQIKTISQVFGLNAEPFFHFVWNQPAGVKIKPTAGAESTLPIRDVTLMVQVLFITLGLLGAFLILLRRRNG